MLSYKAAILLEKIGAR
uniref:Uncharacterized protein n=1 Tax=Rhizophora mucronata TaxID=61149 RepID=A0A2P2JRW9_RHIMU